MEIRFELFFISMCGCIVLKADEKSTQNNLTYVLVCSKCSCREFKINNFASSAPLPGSSFITSDVNVIVI